VLDAGILAFGMTRFPDMNILPHPD